MEKKHESVKRALGWEKTAVGVRYSCGHCSWHISMEQENLREARKLFTKHDCADSPSKK
jgi:hypothetical protein